MNEQMLQQTDKQAGMTPHPNPTTDTPGVLVAGPEARRRVEEMDPTVEDAYWRSHYSDQDYVERNAPYSAYHPAYRTGYEGRSKYPGKKFAEVETSLQRDFEKSKGNSTLTWDQARNATRDAWHRVGLVRSGEADGNRQ